MIEPIASLGSDSRYQGVRPSEGVIRKDTWARPLLDTMAECSVVVIDRFCCSKALHFESSLSFFLSLSCFSPRPESTILERSLQSAWRVAGRCRQIRMWSMQGHLAFAKAAKVHYHTALDTKSVSIGTPPRLEERRNRSLTAPLRRHIHSTQGKRSCFKAVYRASRKTMVVRIPLEGSPWVSPA